MSAQNNAPRGQDISIVKLVPRNERLIANCKMNISNCRFERDVE
jgi:hypothetical protein